MTESKSTSISLKDLSELDLDSPLALEWEKLVSENPASGFMQSLNWARFKRKMGLSVYHVGLFDGTKLKGGAIFYSAPNSKGAGLLAAPDGPVLPWHDSERIGECEEGLKLLLDAARSKASSLGTMALRIAPRLPTPKPEILSGFSRAPIALTESKTMYLNLEPDLDTILLSVRPKARYNIGLSSRKGVTIREDSDLSVGSFYKVMEQVARRDGFALEPLSFFRNLFDTLCPSGLARIFFAEHEGDILGALFMVTYGGRSTYLYGGTTDTKRNYMGGYSLQWAAIKAAKEDGCRHYDFWGYDPAVLPGSAYAGFSRFKSQFSGEYIELVGSLDYYFMDKLADVVIRALNEISVS